MLSKKQLQFLKSLHQKKNRQMEGLFLVEGKKNIIDLFESKLVVRTFIYADGNEISEFQIPSNTDILVASRNDFSRFSYLKSPEGYAAIVEIPSYTFQWSCRKVLVLENINDPGNLGTLLRSSDWFGIDAVVISPNTTDPFSPKAVQAAKGSTFRVPIIQTDIRMLLEEMREKRFSVYALDMQGEDLGAVSPPERWAIVLGNEANGLTSAIYNFCSHRLRIDQKGGSAIDSLNVGIAGSIALYELTRKV